MFITLLLSYVAPMYSYVTNLFVYNLYITLCVCLLLGYAYVLLRTRRLLVCTRVVF